MTKLFLTVVNMSITGGFVILFVLAARLLLKRAPKVYSYALWSAALFRLLVPFSMESAFSLLPVKPSPIPKELATSTNPYEWTVNSGVTVVDSVVNPVLYEVSPGTMNSKLTILAALWIMGVLLMAGYSLLSLFRLTRQLHDADRVQDNIYCSQRIGTAFVLGFVHPKIYMPDGLSGQEREYILLHEQTHIRRKDHWIKVLSFIALCVHWFDPLVWLAFFLSAQDMEMSCDEAVVKKMGSSIKKDYSLSLLSLASGRRLVGGSPLAFGEGDTRGRIKNILRFKKPAVWVAVAAAVLVLAAVFGLMTNRPTEDGEALADQLIASIHKRDSITLDATGLEFTIPDCQNPEDFNIFIYGRRKIGEDSMSVHPLEELNALRSWEADTTYLIPISGVQYESLMMSVYLDSVPNFEKTVDLLAIWGLTENESIQAEEPAANSFAVKFPAYDQRTEYNGAIMDVEPFYLCMILPDGWNVKERPESESKYPLMGAWTPLGVYNEAGDCIGSVAYNIYEEIPESDGNPMAVYNQVALGNHYSFDCHDSYQVVNETEQGETAVTEVYISQMFSQELGYGGASDVLNWGILSYDRERLIYIAMELDSKSVTEEQTIQIARTVELRPVEQEQNTLEFTASQLELGEQAAKTYLDSFLGESVPAEQRLFVYGVEELQTISGDTKAGMKWEDMAYQYVVRVTYTIETASEDYLSPGDGVAGKGRFEDLFRELCVKHLGGDKYRIVSVGTGGGEKEFLK